MCHLYVYNVYTYNVLHLRRIENEISLTSQQLSETAELIYQLDKYLIKNFSFYYKSVTSFICIIM